MTRVSARGKPRRKRSSQNSSDETGYDAVLIMATYKRTELLARTLRQLRDEETRFQVKVLVLNDGNPSVDIAPIVRDNPNVVFLHNRANNGKRRYFRTVTTLLQEASGFNYRYLIQMDDDFEPVHQFFDTIIGHLDRLQAGTILKYVTTENSEREVDNWVDGGSAYPRAFWDEIGHRIDPIRFWRWLKNPQASSGVWPQVTEKLNSLGYTVEFLSNSMADHLGYQDSVMNTALRREKQMRTLNFSKTWAG